jgi:glycerol-3-phosphate dehydrogenase (NAD(P)+)
MQFGVIGSGSWATALVKLLTDNKNPIYWWVRNERLVTHIQDRKHNPSYLRSVHFNTELLTLSADIQEIVAACDCLIIAVPSAYVVDTLAPLSVDAFHGKKVVSAVKGILPEENILLNDFLKEKYSVALEDYFTIMGPCHAEEVASEKLSYLTFSGTDEVMAAAIASHFKGYHLNTIVNNDIYGVQYAAVLKNIYAVGSGIAHGLEYGDNFLSVLIANAADEMAGFLQKVGIRNMEVGIHAGEDPITHQRTTNYAASAYLGDLLVTCYSPYSRNRTFGNMVGKGYPVKTAQLEMNMVAEGYNASKCMYLINKEVRAEMPIAETIYKILWTHLSPDMGFRYIEEKLV